VITENGPGDTRAESRGTVLSVPSPNSLDEEGRWIVAQSLEAQLHRNVGPGIVVVPETSSCAAGFGYRIEIPADKQIKFRDVWRELPPQTLPGCRRPGMPYRLLKVRPSGELPTVAEQLELFELAEVTS